MDTYLKKNDEHMQDERANLSIILRSINNINILNHNTSRINILNNKNTLRKRGVGTS